MCYPKETIISIMLIKNKNFEWLKVRFQVVTVNSNLVPLTDNEYIVRSFSKWILELFKILTL